MEHSHPHPQIKKASNGMKVRPEVNRKMSRLFDTPFHKALELHRLINEADYDCDFPPIAEFIDVIYGRLTPDETEVMDALNELGVYVWTTLAVLINGRSQATDVFYPSKQQGTEYQKRFKDLQRFWDVYSKNISLFSFSGQMLRDDEYMIPAVEYLFWVNRTEAQVLIDLVQETFATYPAIGYDLPFWSLNAFASIKDPSEPDFKGDVSIVMGDGVTMFMEYVGLSDAGPDAVIFHEFGHHVEFGLGYPEVTTPFEDLTPEIARYNELLADGFSAYFAHHPRGASFQANRIAEVSRALYGVGDCDFNFTNHHGTPDQREKASRFGVKVVKESKGKGKILKAAEFKAKFDTAYPDIIAPDNVV